MNKDTKDKIIASGAIAGVAAIAFGAYAFLGGPDDEPEEPTETPKVATIELTKEELNDASLIAQSGVNWLMGYTTVNLSEEKNKSLDGSLGDPLLDEFSVTDTPVTRYMSYRDTYLSRNSKDYLDFSSMSEPMYQIGVVDAVSGITVSNAEASSNPVILSGSPVKTADILLSVDHTFYSFTFPSESPWDGVMNVGKNDLSTAVEVSVFKTAEGDWKINEVNPLDNGDVVKAYQATVIAPTSDASEFIHYKVPPIELET